MTAYIILVKRSVYENAPDVSLDWGVKLDVLEKLGRGTKILEKTRICFECVNTGGRIFVIYKL